MTRHRFTIAQLMALILYVGLSFAALRNANDFWASATFTVAILAVSVALVGVIARKGKDRMTWTGFAVFGWTCLLVVQLPPWPIGGQFGGPVPKPVLLIEWGMARLQSYINPLSLSGGSWVQYDQISHSLGIILFGLVGAVLARLLAVKDDRPNP